MERAFKVGDVVFLKSHPFVKMTINGILGSRLQCRWFVGETLHEEEFLPDALQLSGGG